MQLLTIYNSSGLNMGSSKGPTWQGSRCREAASPNRLVPRQGTASHRGRRAIVKDSGPASRALPCLHSWPSFSIWGPPYGALEAFLSCLCQDTGGGEWDPQRHFLYSHSRLSATPVLALPLLSTQLPAPQNCRSLLC